MSAGGKKRATVDGKGKLLARKKMHGVK